MPTLEAIDTSLFHLLNLGGSLPPLDVLMQGLTWIGRKMWLGVLLLPLWIWKGSTRDRHAAVLFLLAVALCDALPTYVLKPFFARPRPFLTLPDAQVIISITHISPFSFPSNHASNSFGMATLLTLFYGKTKWVPWTAYGIASVVCASRIYVGVHYPLDVLGGAVFGSAVALSVFFGWKKWVAPRVGLL